VRFPELVRMMVDADIELQRSSALPAAPRQLVPA
jgi:hypothetical protein